MEVRFPHIIVPSGIYPDLKALRELFRHRDVFPHLDNIRQVVTFDTPTERELEDEEFWADYENWKKLDENRWGSLIMFLSERFEKKCRIKTISTYDMLSDEEKQNVGKHIPRGNMLDDRF